MEKSYQSQSNQLKTAVIYARYSSENQTEQSIEGQLRVCTDYAKSNNIVIVNTYIDRAMTGTNDNRPAFQQMLKDSSNGNWDYVLVYKFDRFSRNKYETAIHKKTLKDNGVKLKSATEYLPDTPEAIIMESMFEGYAEYYSAELSQKVKRGMNETRLKGNFTGGNLLYGYKIVNKKVVINEEEAEIVRYIYEQYSYDVAVKDIIKALTEKGVYYKGKEFLRNTVYNMLKNEKYSGIYRFKNEVFTDMYPRIVPQNIFDRVHKKIVANKYGTKSEKIDYLLRHKLKCGYCGSTVTAETGTARSGKTCHYYKCFGRKRANGCTKSIVKKNEFETLILTILETELNKPEIMNIIVDGILKAQETNSRENAVLSMLLSEKKQIEKSLENIMKAIENGIISNTTNKRLHELESKLEDIEKELLIENAKVEIALTESDIREYFKETLKLEAKAFVSILIKEIEMYDDTLKIYFNTPNSSISPDKSQGFCFSKINDFGYKIEMYIWKE